MSEEIRVTLRFRLSDMSPADIIDYIAAHISTETACIKDPCTRFTKSLCAGNGFVSNGHSLQDILAGGTRD